jgi:hypothetical protein
MGRVRSDAILRHFEIIDSRADDAAILQRDEIRVRCRRCDWRGTKEAVALEQHPESCQRCAGKERWTLTRVRTAIRGKRILLCADQRTSDQTDGRIKVRLSDRRYFRCTHCGAVRKTSIMTAVRLKTHHCKSCKPDSQWTLGDFRELVSDLGGKVLGLANKPGSHLITARQKLAVQCPFGHTDEKHANHVSSQKTLCNECSTGLYERIVRSHFQAIFDTAFPRARPEWLVNDRSGYLLELDGFAPDLNVAFEHDGPHHSGRSIRPGQDEEYFEGVAYRDARKETLCRLNGVSLLRIPSLGDELPIADLRQFILDRCDEMDILPDYPDAPADITTVPDTERLLAQAREIVESRGGTLLATEYLGADQPLAVRCQKGHEFGIRLSHLKDRQWRWCRKCYGEQLAREGAARHGFKTYRERVEAWLAESQCSLVVPVRGPIDARTEITIKCRCRKRRSMSAAGVLLLKHHGLCRSCWQQADVPPTKRTQ